MGSFRTDFLNFMLSAYTAFWREGIWPAGGRQWWCPQEVDSQCSAQVPLLAPVVFPPKAASHPVFDGHSTQTARSHLPVPRRAGGAPPCRLSQCFTHAEASHSICLPNDLNKWEVPPTQSGVPTRIKPITLYGWCVILYPCLAVTASKAHFLTSLLVFPGESS